MSKATKETCERLLDCLHLDHARMARTEWASLSDREWEALFALASAQRVDALLAYRLASSTIGGALPAAAREASRETRRRNAQWSLLVRSGLKRLTTDLQVQGVPVILLKGAHLAHAVYPDPSLRWMIDVDLLVRPEDLPRAADVLRAEGFDQLGTSRADAPIVESAHLPRFVRAYPPAVELHWTLAEDGSSDPDELWQRAVPLETDGVAALGLCPEDLLVHVCVHACQKHLFAMGLRPICDVAEIVRRFGGTLAWAEVDARARRQHRQRSVYLVLRLAKEMLGARVPDDVLRAGPSPGFDRALEAARVLALQGRHDRSVPPRVLRAWSAGTWTGRIQAFWRRLFLPADVLAECYDLPRHSPVLRLYYAVRLKDLLMRYGSVLVRLSGRDPALTPTVRDLIVVQDWLSDDTAI